MRRGQVIDCLPTDAKHLRYFTGGNNQMHRGGAGSKVWRVQARETTCTSTYRLFSPTRKQSKSANGSGRPEISSDPMQETGLIHLACKTWTKKVISHLMNHRSACDSIALQKTTTSGHFLFCWYICWYIFKTATKNLASMRVTRRNGVPAPAPVKFKYPRSKISIKKAFRCLFLPVQKRPRKRLLCLLLCPARN